MRRAAVNNMGSKGYVKLDRGILDWEWYRDANTCRVFLHLLLKANWKPGRFKGVEVPRGSLVTSLSKLAEELKLTIRNVRTAIKHLISTGEVTQCCHAKFSVFSIKNYDLYQSGDTQDDSQVTTIEERKNIKNKKDIYNVEQDSKDLFDDIQGEYQCKPADTAKGTEYQYKVDNGSSGYPYKEIIAYLNDKTGKSFKDKSKDTRKHIRQKIDEGYTLEDFKKVIDTKTAEWIGTRWDMYLRPSTLFGENFEAYLNQMKFVYVCGGVDLAAKPKAFGTRFNNFTQRNYDFDSMERLLLAR